ncbi:MAG: hypothetical protein PF503_02065, partial [Desulfobacula sp.]|nr:hypothetical protein [Desulfobacula sp.]
ILVDLTFLGIILNKAEASYRFPIFMLSFILIFMCYFSSAISYKIEVWKNGKIKLTSLRKIIDTKVEDMAYVQGPQLPIGFIKLRLERNKAYLFAKMGTPSLNKVLKAIKTADPGIKFDRIKNWR